MALGAIFASDANSPEARLQALDAIGEDVMTGLQEPELIAFLRRQARDLLVRIGLPT